MEAPATAAAPPAAPATITQLQVDVLDLFDVLTATKAVAVESLDERRLEAMLTHAREFPAQPQAPAACSVVHERDVTA